VYRRVKAIPAQHWCFSSYYPLCILFPCSFSWATQWKLRILSIGKLGFWPISAEVVRGKLSLFPSRTACFRGEERGLLPAIRAAVRSSIYVCVVRTRIRSIGIFQISEVSLLCFFLGVGLSLWFLCFDTEGALSRPFGQERSLVCSRGLGFRVRHAVLYTRKLAM
jgi:hypothetical protein